VELRAGIHHRVGEADGVAGRHPGTEQRGELWLSRDRACVPEGLGEQGEVAAVRVAQQGVVDDRWRVRGQ
jgi:hypothetical protein